MGACADNNVAVGVDLHDLSARAGRLLREIRQRAARRGRFGSLQRVRKRESGVARSALNHAVAMRRSRGPRGVSSRVVEVPTSSSISWLRPSLSRRIGRHLRIDQVSIRATPVAGPKQYLAESCGRIGMRARRAWTARLAVRGRLVSVAGRTAARSANTIRVGVSNSGSPFAGPEWFRGAVATSTTISLR